MGPIKAFYADMAFGQGMPFKTYQEDVRARHKNEFEACLLYLRDFMEALDVDDVKTIQELRTHATNWRTISRAGSRIFVWVTTRRFGTKLTALSSS